MTEKHQFRLEQALWLGYLFTTQRDNFPVETFRAHSWARNVPAIIVQNHGAFSEIEIDSFTNLPIEVRERMSLAILNCEAWLPNRIPGVNAGYTFVKRVPPQRAEDLARTLYEIATR